MNIVPLADHIAHIDEIAQLHQAEWAHMDKSLTVDLRKKALTEAAGHQGVLSIYVAIDNYEFIGSSAIVERDLDTHLELGPWLSAVLIIWDIQNTDERSRISRELCYT